MAKFGTNGELHWVVPIQSSNNVLTGGIAADNSGNIYVTGNFSTETYFDENTSLTPNASTDVFLAKYNNDGELVWVKQYGNLGTLAKFAIEVTDNIYLSGRFINNLTIDTITLTVAGSRKFIAKLDLDANVIWANAYGSSVTGVDVERIAVDNLDNIVTTGRFIGTISIGSEEISSPGNYDIFVLKFNSSGDVLWARTAGGNGFDAAEGLTVDAHNNIYISGFIRETAIFGANEANETTVTSNGDSDIFFAMLYPDGNLSWVIAAGSNGLEIGTSVGTDSFGNVYGTGFFKNSMILGEGEVNETELLTYGNFGFDDIFIVKFASSWDVVSACPLNFAYWKQNEDAFPASALPMTLGTTNSYIANQLTNLLNAPVGGDVSILLVRQLISAKLNIANGAPVPDGLLDLLADADNAIGTGSLPMNVKPNTALGKTMQNLANSIAKYNNNELTPDCEIPENSIYQKEDYLSGFEYEGVTSVDEFTISGFGLSQNFPNPANNSTSIRFTLPATSDVKIDIFNVLGEKIMTVLQANSFEAGTHIINFSTELLQSGSYFYRMTAAQKSHTRIMQIIR